MSESLGVVSKDPRETAAIIAAGLVTWFTDEHRSSAEGNNKVLDNFAGARRDYQRTSDDHFNIRAHKGISHISRVQDWWPDFAADPRDDWLAARQAFGSQMLATGYKRERNFLVAEDEADYLARKFGGQPLDIDIAASALARLTRPDPINLAALSDATEQAIDFSLETTELLFPGGHADVGKEDSPTAQRLVDTQAVWLDLAVDHMIFAARIRDGQLDRVPFLLPLSISEQPRDRTQAVHYPLA